MSFLQSLNPPVQPPGPRRGNPILAQVLLALALAPEGCFIGTAWDLPHREARPRVLRCCLYPTL